jgi:hypothetical protein
VKLRFVVPIVAFAVSCGRETATPVLQEPQQTQRTKIDVPAAPAQTTVAPEPATDDASGAVAVLHRYYDAISAHDFQRAYSCWGSSGPPGQTPEQFASGFAATATVKVDTGEPSRIGAAAGSRYVEVPVTITATTKSGVKQRFGGTYTLRRTVVDGAPASDRAWHLYRGAIRPM